jgi:hypothetical protein
MLSAPDGPRPNRSSQNRISPARSRAHVPKFPQSKKLILPAFSSPATGDYRSYLFFWKFSSVLILTHHTPGIWLLSFLSSGVKSLSLSGSCAPGGQLPQSATPSEVSPLRLPPHGSSSARDTSSQWRWLQWPGAPSSTVSAARGVGDMQEATTRLHFRKWPPPSLTRRPRAGAGRSIEGRTLWLRCRSSQLRRGLRC